MDVISYKVRNIYFLFCISNEKKKDYSCYKKNYNLKKKLSKNKYPIPIQIFKGISKNSKKFNIVPLETRNKILFYCIPFDALTFY